MNWIDTHCHITDKRFAEDRVAMLQNARKAGVTTLVTIGTNPENTREGLALAAEFATPDIYVVAGLHPHEASDFSDAVLADLEELTTNERVVGVGEMGLDYHYDFAPREAQLRAFEAQVQLALRADLPIVIHCREAFDDCMAVLREHIPKGASKKLQGVFHCWSEGPREAQQVMEIGFLLGIGGVSTFKRSDDVREAAKLAGLDRLILETDAPYLAPVPYRGKRNEPAYTAITGRALAEFLGLEPAEVAARTTANARDFFKLPG